ncbi:MAG: prepilin-type N-terminal cleavage/methylation domain-containing protein [Gemmataceae bacterium]|nr:prepilin-type N-terminal cleavage/methylation domain-containing protein [Gemmataceae bacterium]
MMLRKAPAFRRAGFTLVELLVAFALIIFIMSVLAQAFHAAGKVVSDLKAVSDMEERLRGVMVMLRRDLAANHFDESLPGSQRKLSQPTFWDDHLGTLAVPKKPTGFFRLCQYGVPSQVPPVAAPGEIPTHTMAGSILHFTVWRPADTPGNMFSATVAATHDALSKGTAEEREKRFQSALPQVNPFRSPWGEVGYWMTPSGETTAKGPLDPPLYFLRRRQRAMWPAEPLVGSEAAGDAAADRELSVPNAASTQVNDPVRVTLPAFRWNATGDVNPASPTYSRRVAGFPDGTYPDTSLMDIVLPDVISFEVRVLLQSQVDNNDFEFVDLSDARVQAFAAGSTVYPASGAFCFDTWTNQAVGTFSYAGWQAPGTAATIPLYKPVGALAAPIRIRAIQATLRIWDHKHQIARQMTMIQDM